MKHLVVVALVLLVMTFTGCSDSKVSLPPLVDMQTVVHGSAEVDAGLPDSGDVCTEQDQ